MSNYYKPQEPLQINGDYIYPITTIDLVISKDGETRLSDEYAVASADILYTLEEIEASTDLIKKVSGAQAVSELNDQLVKNITYSAVNGVSIVFGGIFASGNIIVINGLLHTTSSVSVDSALFNNFKANGQNINIEDGYIGGVGNITYTIKNGTLTTDSVLDANKYYRILGTLYIN